MENNEDIFITLGRILGEVALSTLPQEQVDSLVEWVNSYIQQLEENNSEQDYSGDECCNTYESEFREEYYDLKDRYDEITELVDRIEATEKYGYHPIYTKSPYDLLKQQQIFMGEYLHILSLRAIVEGIEL